MSVPVEASDGIRSGVVSLPHGWGHSSRSVRASVGGALPGDGVGGAAVDVGLEIHDQTQAGRGLAGSLLSSVDGGRDLVPILLAPDSQFGADEQLLGPQVQRAQVDDALDG